ncbi:MAG: hypothetical protein ACJAZ9_002172 [Neolewinella sp.]|jgi:hypothetical protein
MVFPFLISRIKQRGELSPFVAKGHHTTPFPDITLLAGVSKVFAQSGTTLLFRNDMINVMRYKAVAAGTRQYSQEKSALRFTSSRSQSGI